ncbi:HPF/RaiA family ribosome-associated protein [Candidatus Microgenomates bacterium]|nr:HPF/RaiA family ribosome-associated protein [Candidatus Microgenomates bacterium]
MQFTITTKQTNLTEADYEYFEKFAAKLMKLTAWDQPDFPQLVMTVNKHKKGNAPASYEGTLDLIIPKKRLVAKFNEKTIRSGIKSGFDKLFRELDKYKGMHFKNDSEFPKHRLIKEK